MNNRNGLSMPGLMVERSGVNEINKESMPNHAGSPVNIRLAEIMQVSNVPHRVGQRSGALTELLTVVQAADLLGCHVKTIRRHCAAGKYNGAKKQPGNGGEGWLIPIASLPKAAQKKYAKQFAIELVEKTGVKDVALSAPATPDAEYRQQWDRYERKGSKSKQEAERRLKILLAYLELIDAGCRVGAAEEAIFASHGVSRSAIRHWLDYTIKKGCPRQHWLPQLCDEHHGGRARAAFTPAAYDFILALKVKSPATKLRVLVRTAKKEGVDKGWIFPSEDTIAKRLKEEPAWMFGGMEALERGFPTIERDYASLDLHQCWESDGRKADVFCVWPDGTINRPFVIAIRDVRTRKVLSVRICHAPDTEAVLGAYGTALTNAQAIPSYFKLDNGREYANKAFTGHQKTRYRNKYTADEAVGILTSMAVKVQWSKPGQGRDKPIESWWNVIAENCDKGPEFAGAYCGKDVLSKPEDFDKKKAIPVEAYAAKLTIDVPKGELGRGEQTFSALSEVVGREAAQRLCKHFGGCRFYVPKDAKGHLLDRNRRIVTAYNQGAGIHTLVSDFSLSDRRIRTILKETDMTD